MNRDGGAYNLPTTYDRILVMRSSSTSRDHMPDEYGERNVAVLHEYEYDYHTLILLCFLYL